jgi:hypothetical protein
MGPQGNRRLTGLDQIAVAAPKDIERNPYAMSELLHRRRL